MLDFAVLVTTAAPQLQYSLDAFASDSKVHIAKNPSFRPSEDPYATEKRSLANHQRVLGANLLLSIFSYFETYFFSVIEEIIAFHGSEIGIEKIIRNQLRATRKTPETELALTRLRTTFKPAHADRYRKFSSILKKEQRPWPSQRFMLYGLRQVIAQQKRWKAHDIPRLITDLLVLDLSESERSRFHMIREERNGIAHGKNLSFDLQKAIDVSNFLRLLSMKIDTHIVENFMVIERYAH